MLSIVTQGIILGTTQHRKIQSLRHSAFLSLSFCSKKFLIKIALLDLFRQRVLLYLLFIHHNKGCIENKFKFISKLLHTLPGSVTLSRADRSRFSYTLSFAVPIRPPTMHFLKEWSTIVFRISFQPDGIHSSNIDVQVEAMTISQPQSGQQ